MKQYFLAIAFALVYLFFTKKLTKVKWCFPLLFLFISPWFIQLILSGFEFWWSKPLVRGVGDLIESAIINSSTDYLFFQGDPRVNFGTGETGSFYIFQIPLILMGFYVSFDRMDNYKKILLAWLLGGFLFASCFASSPDFSNGLFYFLPLQLISFLAFSFALANWQQGGWLRRSLIAALALLAIYEMIIFFHILIIHYPKRLLIK